MLCACICALHNVILRSIAIKPMKFTIFVNIYLNLLVYLCVSLCVYVIQVVDIMIAIALFHRKINGSGSIINIISWERKRFPETKKKKNTTTQLISSLGPSFAYNMCMNVPKHLTSTVLMNMCWWTYMIPAFWVKSY